MFGSRRIAPLLAPHGDVPGALSFAHENLSEDAGVGVHFRRIGDALAAGEGVEDTSLDGIEFHRRKLI